MDSHSRGGREFNDTDDAQSEPVVIINEAVRRRSLGDVDAIGSSFVLGGRRVKVVGVVATGKYRTLSEDPMSHVYLSSTQHHRRRMTLHIRTGQPESTIRELKSALTAINPGLVLGNVQSMSEHLRFATLVSRISAEILGALGVVAITLCSFGVYGLVAFSVESRRRELCVRLALGASVSEVRHLVVRHVLSLALVGTIVGSVLAAGVGRLVRPLLVNVPSFDPLALGGGRAARCLSLSSRVWRQLFG